MRAPFAFSGLPFILLVFFLITGSEAAPTSTTHNCSAHHYQETVTADYVYDGDTIHLHDGRKLRLIGINTPEHGKKGKEDEPFYRAAKIQLQHIINNTHGKLKLVYGEEKHDHYHRLLANIFTPEGVNISAALLRKGLGYSIAIPPNIKFLECYRDAERQAKNLKKGLWNHPFGQPIDVAVLKKSTSGFHQVIGTVERIGESRSSFWLNLSPTFALRIAKKDLAYFDNYTPASLLHKRIVARGWIYKVKHEQRMSIQHPASLQILNTD